jgi:hypothetical protein
MSNSVEKDIIGEHEGFLSNPFIAFFLAILILSLFAILGGVFHTSKRAESSDTKAREERFSKIELWRKENPSELESYKVITSDNSQSVVYQIPLAEAKKLVINQYSQASN